MAAAQPVVASLEGDGSDDRVLLPKTVKPSHYDLKYSDIDLVNFTFTGTVDIALEASESSSLIVCNSADIKVQKAVYVQGSGPAITAYSTSYDEHNQCA